MFSLPRSFLHAPGAALTLIVLFGASLLGACSEDPAPQNAQVTPGDEDAGGNNAAADVGDDVEEDTGEDDTGGDVMDEPDVPTSLEPIVFGVRPGVEIATVLGADPGASLTLRDSADLPLLTLLADDLGQAHFAYIPAEHMTLQSGAELDFTIAEGTTLTPGAGYSVLNNDTGEVLGPFTVLAVGDVPDTDLYDRQELQGITFGLFGLGPGEEPDDGFNYIEMRDGVRLSATVRFPDPALWGEGPYPTVIEYSGYSTSRPDGPDAGTRIATLLGFATVGVNMRGTGCSGGVFDVFSPAQHADGYDVIEVVARQPWVLHNKVGMIGLSYSGIAQLYVARTRPPSLAAITPQSVIGDSWGQLWPGGIYNDGFTRQWLEQRDDQASSGGQSWTDVRIEGGDLRCERHQDLRNQNIKFETFFKLLEFYPDDAYARSLPLLIKDIDVPVYLTGAFQDEQTGAQFGDMLGAFENVPSRVFTLYNGRHPDGYSPLVVTRWLEFMHFYISKKVPRIPDIVRVAAGPELSHEFGVAGLGFEPDRFTDFADDDYEGALAAYEAEPDVRVLFENGGVPEQDPGAPQHRFEQTFPSWPPPDATPTSIWLSEGGGLSVEAPPVNETVESYLHDPDGPSSTFFGPRGYQLLAPLWDIDWTRFEEDQVLSYISPPLAEELVVAGSGHVVLWFQGEVDDVHVQTTITEVRPDDTEYLVQSGWLRLGHRKVDAERSTETYVAYTYREEDFEPLVPGEWTEVKVALPTVAHAFRAGTRVRLTISTPGRNHGTWEFAPPDYAGETPRHRVSIGGATPSRLVLPTVTGVPVVEGFPACPGLRGQPCRDYVPVVNSGEGG